MSEPADMAMTSDTDLAGLERLLLILAFATFVVFIQAYAIAPMLPELAADFHDEMRETGLAAPAYLIPYGIATLGTGVLADRLGIAKVMLGSRVLFILLVLATALCRFLGFGIGSLAFGQLMAGGFSFAFGTFGTFGTFAIVEALLALIAIRLFFREAPRVRQ